VDLLYGQYRHIATVPRSLSDRHLQLPHGAFTQSNIAASRRVSHVKTLKPFPRRKLALTIIAAIVIATGVAGLTTSILGVRPLLLLLFIFGLIVLFFTWLLFGITFMLDK
jgi:hypothetical protein